MSASLVGSEMCIRDRLNFNRQRPAPVSWAPLWPVGRRQDPVHRIARLHFCLLYTSDAADDM
eukprot:10313290-Alexandrium_andersonii.AAC.1